MARGNSKELPPRPIVFDSFALEHLQLKEVPPKPKSNTDPRITEREAETPCTFTNPKTKRGVNGILSIRSKVTAGYTEETLTFEKMTVTLATRGTEIRMGFNIYHRPASVYVGTDIAREEKGSKHKLPPGTGILLYEKGLDYLKTLARVKPLTHGVERSSMTTLETSLSRGQWERIFPPILKKRGYREVSSGIWEKVYTPES